MEILYQDTDVFVCIKPAGVLSTDEPGGLPDLVRQALGDEKADVRTVHRLDRVVSGVMVLARCAKNASELSRQIRENAFQKAYLAVVHGSLPEDSGTLRDLLYRDKARKMTMVAQQPSKETREAVLHYQVLGRNENMTLVKILLETGRTHQIRVQFSSRGYPLVGERKYAQLEDACGIALWSHSISFYHPRTGDALTFTQNPGQGYPWELFSL